MFNRGDSIVAHRDFIVQDLLTCHGVTVNRQLTNKKPSQIPTNVETMSKKFKILKSELHSSYVPLGGRILFVCFAVQNFMTAAPLK